MNQTSGTQATKTAGDVEELLYEKREKIYPRQVHGLFAGLRISAVLTLLGIYYIVPWLTWDGRQLVLFDLPARKFHIFGITFWPQDFLFLTFFLMICAFSLFFFTALAGRLWCGYACPQTVWTETFLWMERLVEGNRLQQMKLDKAPMSLKKFRIKVSKHTLWVLFSLFTGFTFVAYFTPATELLARSLSFQLSGWETFWIVFYGFATYGNAGWMREQVCKYMCPYARFQSAMFDDDTLIVSYDEKRGDPKGSRKAGIDHRRQGLGDCIDCTMCVQVCPTGIDIRDGLQYECISCSSCIDVCNDVMDKMGYERGLIRYSTLNEMSDKASKIIRPRIVIYLIILIILVSIFSLMLFNRSPIALDVIRDRNQLFRETQGLIENVYTLKIINMDNIDHSYTLSAEGIDNLQLVKDMDAITVESGTVLDLPVRVRASEDSLDQRSQEIYFTLQSMENSELTITQDAKFIGPQQ